MKRMLTLVGLLGLTTLTACVNPDDIKTLDNRVYNQKVRIDSLETKVGEMATPDPQQADTWSQVQSMRRELAAVHNEMDNLRQQLAEQQALIDANTGATKTLSGDMKDVHSGWLHMTSQLGVDVDLAAIRAKRIAAENAASKAPAAPQTEDATPTPVTDGEGDLGASTSQNGTQPAAITPAPAAPQKPVAKTDTPKALYDTARAAFEARNYAEGQARWEEFATNFPKHQLVPNALFWQGECYYQLKDYARAVLMYQEVIDNYKKSTKYPTSLFKQGLSFMRLGRVKAGRLLLHDVIDKFPKSVEARRAKAILKEL